MSSNEKPSFLKIALIAIIIFSVGYIFSQSSPSGGSAAADTGLEIVDYNWKLDGDYIYVTGSVDNKSDKTYGYFKVTAHFLDYSGKVIDTGFTNSAETLGPGMAKQFQIMHKYSEDYKDTKVFIEEANEKL